ncbi:MAG: methyltransferase domain-containing protein [Longimicrobiales bacterium]|nr:methyltransferase domain-containing protein [Longimicrobiales bacterium]
MTMSSLVVPDLSIRHRQAELMDDPGLEPERHQRALIALSRINRVSYAVPRLWHEVARVHRSTGRAVRVLDVACGGADMLIAVARIADRKRVPVELVGCDLSGVALERADMASGGRVRTLQMNVLTDDLSTEADVVTTNLFLHHLSAEEACTLLRRMARSARDVLIVQDLRRTRLGYVLAWVGLHTLTRSDVARIDGLRSVRAAFTLDEVRGLAERAELPTANIKAVWPQRFVLRWRPST